MPATGKEMLQYLKLHGWRLDRIQGGHHIMEKDGEPRKISVPVHGNRTLARDSRVTS
jgi:predicted RNA binding protein YcfA (HicA-like mRNA interferase family)